MDDDRRLDARIVALIDEDGEQERLAVPLKEAVLALFPAGLGQQPAGLVHILLNRRQPVVVGPCPRLVRPHRGHALPEQHAVDERLAFDGHRNGPADAHILKERMLKIEPEEGVAERQVAIFAPILFPLRPLRLAQVLLGGKGHHIQLSGLQLQKHGRGIGDNPVHHLIQIGTALEIGIRSRKGKHGTGVPFGKPVRPRADGLAGCGRGHDILPLKHMLGQNGPHPCHQGAGERLGITHLERQPPCLPEGFDGEEVPGIGRGRLGIDHEPVGEFHIVRR